MEYILETRGLTKVYGNKEAAKDGSAVCPFRSGDHRDLPAAVHRCV